MNTYTIEGIDSIRKKVSDYSTQTSGVVYVPSSWAGKTVTIVLEADK